MNKFPSIATDRLVLNQLQRSDIYEIVQLLNEKVFSENAISLPYPYFPRYAEFWLGVAQKGFEEKNKYIFAIRQKDNPKIIGGIEIGIDTKNNKAELGYWMGKKYWNQGYMTEAVKSVIEFGFKLGLKKISASHFSTNPASGKVMIKAGMKKEGMLRCHTKKGDSYQDHVVYAIIQE